ncbi:MAG TPA: hypothetical protein PK264_05080 [Hyphomicrobiaceae bacterium]|nr:hypothetical protein [Hyphomicrobiaceae bacterium]
MSEASNLFGSTAGGPLTRFQLAARAIAISVPVLGAIPTGMNLYQSWKHGVPYSEVSHRLAQYDLWMKNGSCNINYREVNAQKGAKVMIGACPTTGDISIKLAYASGQAKYEWIAFDTLHKTAGLLDAILPAAHAEEPKGASERLKVAQAAGAPGAEVKCQVMAAGKMIRIVGEGSKCFRETIHPFQGKLEKREEIECAKACPVDPTAPVKK